MKEILLTNDDGIQSLGLIALADSLSSIARVTVVAPDREISASSQSLTLQRPVRYEEISPGRFSVEGTPTDCVIIAIHRILQRVPDLVISGINKGPNLGHDIGYSGTVSAALEAANHGIPAFAISLAARQDFRFVEAAQLSVLLAEKLLVSSLPAGVILNVNMPNQEMKGIRITYQGQRNVRNLIVESQDPRGRKYFWFDQEINPTDHSSNGNSDYVAVNSGFVSITPLKLDRTAYECVGRLKEWPETLLSEKIGLLY